MLGDSVNPEITHYQNGHHPGLGWYLKTVFPACNASNAAAKINLAIVRLKQCHAHLVYTNTVAYNWSQQLMPGWHSLWLRIGHDVRFTTSHDGNLDYEIWDQQQLFVHEAEVYNIMIQEQIVKNRKNKTLVQELKQLGEITCFLQNYSSDSTAQHNRSKFKVISGGKI